jgi:hypothetical protein
MVGFIFMTKLVLAVWVNTYCAVGTITAHPMPPFDISWGG